MKTRTGKTAMASVLLASLLLTGCGISTPKTKQNLLREAESVAHGKVTEVSYDSVGTKDYPANRLVLEDKEYGFEFYIESKIQNAGGLDGTSLTNPITSKSVKARVETNDFYTQYMKYFFEYNENEIADLKETYGVEITYYKTNYNTQFFIEVYACEDEDDAEKIFAELSDLLENYDTRGYFAYIEKNGGDYVEKNGFRIAFHHDEKGTGSYNSKDIIKDYDLEPQKW